MVAFCRVVAVVAVLLVGAIPAAFAADKDNAWIVDTAIPNLLRFNLNGALVSSDLGDYIRFTCTGEGKDRTCDVDQSNLKVSDTTKFTQPSSDDIQSYGTGVALYFVVALVAAVLVVFGTLLYLLCCQVVCGTVSILCLLTSRKKFRKSYFPKEVLQGGAAAMSLIFFAFLATMVILAYSLGVKVAFEGMTDVVDAPLGVAQITYQLSLAMQPAFIGIVSKVMLPTLRNLNSTFCDVVNWEAVINDLKSLNSSVKHLPNFDVINDRLTNIDTSTDELNDKLTAIFNFNDDYDAKKQVVSDRADVVQDDLNDLEDGLLDLRGFVDSAQDSASDLSTAWTALYGAGGPSSYTATDQDGYIDSVQYDIDHMVRDDTPGDGIPTIATLNSAATGATASVDRLLNDDLDGNFAELLLMNAKLHDIYDSVVLMPNFTKTANNLIAINNTITDLLSSDGAVTVLPGQLLAIQTQLSAMPNATLIKIHVAQLFAAVDDLNSDTLSSLLDDSKALIDSIPADIDVILGELDKVSDTIRSVRAPLYDLVVIQPRGFNETIMESPYDGTKIFKTINETITTAAESSDEVTKNLRDLNQNIRDQVDITDFIEQVDEAQGEVDGAKDDVDRDALDDALTAAEIDTTFNATQYNILLKSVSSALGHAKIYPDMIASFVALEQVRYDLEVALRDTVGEVGDDASDGTTLTAAGDYVLLAQGVCSTDTTDYCSVNTDCTSNSCTNIGVYRCSANGDASYPVTTCTDDSDCAAANSAALNGGSSHCLADTDRATDLKNYLLALASPTLADFGQDDVNDNFDNLRTASAAMDVDQLSTDLATIQSDIDDADPSAYQAQIQELQDSLNDDSLTIADIMDPLRDTQSDIGSLDFSDITDQLGDVQEQIDKYGDKLEDYIGFAEDLQKYIFHENDLKSRFDELSEDHLNTVLDEEGFGAVLVSTGQTFEGTSDDILAIMKNNSFSEERVEMTKSLRDPAMYMNRFTGNPHAGFYDVYEVGSLYYMMQLTNTTAKLVVDAHDPKQDLILTNSDGDSYEDDKYCVTRNCFANQQDDFQNGYGTFLPLVLVPLASIALIALCNFGCVFAGPKVGCCRMCMPWWMLCMIIVIVPWYLILSGLFFTFFITLSDGCTSGPHIAANYITSYGDAFCDRLGGNGTLAACRFQEDDLDVTINIARMSDIILGIESCSGNDEDDPFYIPLHALGNDLKSYANTRTRREVNKKDYRKYRQPVKNIVLDASDGAADVVHELLDNLGSDVITCDNMQDVIQYMKKPVCYSVVGPWTWMLATIYLAAWSLCCLGIPTGCALKNTFKWEYIEFERKSSEAKKKAAAAAAVQRSLLKFYMLGRRGRGPMAGRNIPVAAPTGEPEVGDEDEEGGGGAYAGGGGGHGHGHRHAAEEDESGEGAAEAEEVQPAQSPAGGGYMARYPKYTTSSKDGEKFIAEGGKAAYDEEKSQDSEGDNDGRGDSEENIVVFAADDAHVKV